MQKSFWILTLLFTVLLLSNFKVGTKEESKRDAKSKKALLEIGAKLYEKYACMSCHGKEGKAIGDLRKAYAKYTNDEMKNYIRNPRKYGNKTMPVFGEVIPDSDFPPLLAYVRFLGEKAALVKK